MPYILFVLAVLIAFWMVSACNRLTRMRNRASEAYLAVKGSLDEEKTERKKIYNDIARSYNRRLTSFPYVIVATLFSFEEVGTFKES